MAEGRRTALGHGAAAVAGENAAPGPIDLAVKNFATSFTSWLNDTVEAVGRYALMVGQHSLVRDLPVYGPRSDGWPAGSDS